MQMSTIVLSKLKLIKLNYKLIIKLKNLIMLYKIACIWGCSSTCTIESNYICTGGTTSNLMSGTWTFLPVT